MLAFYVGMAFPLDSPPVALIALFFFLELVREIENVVFPLSKESFLFGRSFVLHLTRKKKSYPPPPLNPPRIESGPCCAPSHGFLYEERWIG